MSRPSFTVEEAYEIGRHRGWEHANFVDACGTASDNGKTMDEISDASMPGGLDSYPGRAAAYREGWDAGLAQWEIDQAGES